MPFDPNVRLDQFTKDIEVLEKEFIKSISALVKNARRSRVEDFSLFLTQYDFWNVLIEQGYEGKVKQFLNDWDLQVIQLMKLAKNMDAEMVAQVTVNDLQTLKNIEYDKLLRRGQDYAGDVRGELLKQLMNGASMDQISKNVLPQIQEKMVFYPSWFNSMLNTAYSEYNAVALGKLTDDIPGIRFRLMGPVDTHTRKQCFHAMSIMNSEENANGFTKAEINNGVLGTYKFKNKNGITGLKIYDFKDRGGFNCRHYFEVVTESITNTIEVIQ